MYIFIPTRGRVDHQYTARAIPNRWRGVTFIVCPSEEVEAHKKLGLNIIPYDKVGLSPKRQFILEWAHAKSKRDPMAHKILQLDDDLKFFKRGPPRDPKSKTPFSLYDCTPGDMDTMLVRADALLTDHAHIGIDTREGCQNHTDGGGNIRITRALGYRVDVLMKHGVRFDAVGCMQDFHAGLALLQLGYASATVKRYVQNQARASGADGGCSTYRTAAFKKECAEALVKLHDPFVQLVHKAKGWKGMKDGMVDVKVAWKKAYEFGCTLYGKQDPLF